MDVELVEFAYRELEYAFFRARAEPTAYNIREIGKRATAVAQLVEQMQLDKVPVEERA